MVVMCQPEMPAIINPDCVWMNLWLLHASEGGLKHSNNSDHVIVLNRSVQNLRLAVFRSDRTSILQRLRDAGFERIRFLRFLNAKTWDKLQRGSRSSWKDWIPASAGIDNLGLFNWIIKYYAPGFSCWLDTPFFEERHTMSVPWGCCWR